MVLWNKVKLLVKEKKLFKKNKTKEPLNKWINFEGKNYKY